MQSDEDMERRVEALGAAGRWSDVMRHLVEEAERTPDEDRAVELRVRVARLALDRFSNQAIAIEHLSIVARLRPDHPSRDELIGILRDRRDWNALERLLGSAEAARLRDDSAARPALEPGGPVPMWVVLAALVALALMAAALAWSR